MKLKDKMKDLLKTLKQKSKAVVATGLIGATVLTATSCAGANTDIKTRIDELDEIYLLETTKIREGKSIYSHESISYVDAQVKENEQGAAVIDGSSVKVLTNAKVNNGADTQIMYTYPATEENIEDMKALADLAETLNGTDDTEKLCNYLDQVKAFLNEYHKANAFSVQTNYTENKQLLDLVAKDGNGQILSDSSNNIMQTANNYYWDTNKYEESVAISKLLKENNTLQFSNAISVNNIENTATVFTSIGIHKLSYTIKVDTRAHLTAEQLTSLVTQYLFGEKEFFLIDETGKNVSVNANFNIVADSFNWSTSCSTALWDNINAILTQNEVIDQVANSPEVDPSTEAGI